MRQLLSFVTVLLVAACSSEVSPRIESVDPVVSETATTLAVPSDAPIIVTFGDSLTAGYGLQPRDSYPSVLQTLLAEQGTPYRVVNEGVSGDTTATALTRVEGAATHEAELVIVAIGANDGLRGLPIDEMESNLREIIQHFRDAGRSVALAGMRIPPNMGPEYVGQFETVYPRVATDMDVPLLDFLLEGVAGDPDLNQDDGIHPNERGAHIVAGLVVDFVNPLLTVGESSE